MQEHGITLAYAHALIEAMRLDEAETVLDGVRMADKDAAYEQLRAQLEIKREASKSPEIEALEQKLADSPDDLDVRYQLGVQYTDNGQFREAMEHLVEILRRILIMAMALPSDAAGYDFVAGQGRPAGGGVSA